jgi:hypothetical protein
MLLTARLKSCPSTNPRGREPALSKVEGAPAHTGKYRGTPRNVPKTRMPVTLVDRAGLNCTQKLQRVLDSNPAPSPAIVELHTATDQNYLNAITPNNPSRLLPGPAVKNS